MQNGIFFSIISLIYSILITVVFFSKKRFDSYENKAYKKIIIINLIGLLIEVFPCTYAIRYLFPVNSTLALLILKSILIYFIAWIGEFTHYIALVSFKLNNFDDAFIAKNDKLIQRVLIFLYLTSALVVYILPLYAYFNNGAAYTYGPAATYIYAISGILMFLWGILLFMSRKSVKSKKYMPLFAFMLIGVVVIIIQSIYPELTLMIPMQTFITFLMYFTIENPDLQMVTELEKNRQLVASSFEDKSVYLFKMTQQVREPVMQINESIKVYENASNNKEREAIIQDIKKCSNSLMFVINDVLDVSSLDVNKIKIFNNTYNVYLFFRDIQKKAEQLIKNKDVKLYFNINQTIPKELYGDSVKLKQVMMSVISNAFQYTEKGNVEINIEGISRYDICRLIINVKDSGTGMSLEQVNSIMDSTGELTDTDLNNLDKIDVQLKSSMKIVKLLGGSVNIVSDIGKGTEISIVLDQKVKLNPKKDTDSYVEGIFRRKSILIVDDDSNEINKIVRMFTKEEIKVNISMYGKECISRIQSGEKYDLIIMDDEMVPDNALPTLEELKEIKKFDIPVVVMLNKEKEFIKKHYLTDGFDDYLLKDKMDSEITRIMDKYL